MSKGRSALDRALDDYYEDRDNPTIRTALEHLEAGHVETPIPGDPSRYALLINVGLALAMLTKAERTAVEAAWTFRRLAERWNSELTNEKADTKGLRILPRHAALFASKRDKLIIRDHFLREWRRIMKKAVTRVALNKLERIRSHGWQRRSG